MEPHACVQQGGPGSQNPIYTNIGSGGFMDHDNNQDGLLSPAVVGGTVDGFGFANLGRSYAYSIEVEQIPEPSAAIFSLLGLLGLFFLGGLILLLRNLLLLQAMFAVFFFLSKMLSIAGRGLNNRSLNSTLNDSGDFRNLYLQSGVATQPLKFNFNSNFQT